MPPFNAIPSSNLMKRIAKQNLASRDKAQILSNSTVFRDKSSNYQKVNPVTRDFFHHKSSGVTFYILNDFDQNLSIGF